MCVLLLKVLKKWQNNKFWNLLIKSSHQFYGRLQKVNESKFPHNLKFIKRVNKNGNMNFLNLLYG